MAIFSVDDGQLVLSATKSGTTTQVILGNVSAYALARQQGFEGTLDEYLASLKGDTGEQGEVGPIGPEGTRITNAEIDDNGHLIVTFSDDTYIDAGKAQGPQGIQGKQGYGVSSGGLKGDLLVKTSSDTDYETGWATISNATQSTAGWMSAEDKTIIDNLSDDGYISIDESVGYEVSAVPFPE